jgi:hypothetical protein
MKKVIISLVLMVVMFFISGLFFLNSEMFDENGDFSEKNAIAILTELDKIPLLDFDVDSIRFNSYGTVISIEDGSILVSSKNKGKEFIYYDNLSKLGKGDKVMVLYEYSPEGEIEVTSLKLDR